MDARTDVQIPARKRPVLSLITENKEFFLSFIQALSAELPAVKEVSHQTILGWKHQLAMVALPFWQQRPSCGVQFTTWNAENSP